MMTLTTSQPSVTKGALSNSVLFTDMPASEYHSDIGVQSCSLLKPILDSPAHYQAQFFNGHKSTPAMAYGTLVHCLVLEPGKFAKEYAVYQGDVDRRSSDYKDFVAANAGRTVIDEAELAQARALQHKILERRILGRPFGDYVKEGIPEATIYYDDPSTNTRCRCRIDLLHPEIDFDLKTTSYPNKDSWLRHGLSLHYDMQAYMYSLCAALYFGDDRRRPFIFVAGESERPHSVGAYTAGSTFIENGSVKYNKAIAAYTACAKINHWPDLSQDATLDIHHWQAESNSQAWTVNATP